MTVTDHLPEHDRPDLDQIDGAAVLRLHEPWLRRVLWNRVGDRDAVDDLMQEIGLAISKEDRRPEDTSKLPAWLYQVAIRQAYQYRRKMGRYRRMVTNVTEKQPPALAQPTEQDPLAWILGRERQHAVREAINELSETNREILLLKYSENWTYQQLADRLGVTVHTIEHRLLKAKKKLRQILSAAHIEV